MKEDAPEMDLYGLYLLRLVAKFRGFTAASREAGISQSALTRQVQGLEEKLGIKVFERTTRSVKLTEGGAVFLRETEALPNILAGALRRVREDYLNAPREIRVAVSPSLALAHIPGIFRSRKRTDPEIKVVVSQESESSILDQVRVNRLDLGIVTKPEIMPESVEVSHMMEDRFCVVAPSDVNPPDEEGFRAWAEDQVWMLPPSGGEIRRLIDSWAKCQKARLQGTIELEDFDLMNQLVALGMGVAFVPRRSLSGLARRHRLQKIPIPAELVRQVIVVAPMHAKAPEHVNEFVDGILFS